MGSGEIQNICALAVFSAIVYGALPSGSARAGSPPEIFREILCSPVAWKTAHPAFSDEGARIGPRKEGALTLISNIGIRPISPYQYLAEGTLYVDLISRGLPTSRTLTVHGNYLETESGAIALLSADEPAGAHEIGVIHLDFSKDRPNGSFIEKLDGTLSPSGSDGGSNGKIFLMDCSQSPETFKH